MQTPAAALPLSLALALALAAPRAAGAAADVTYAARADGERAVYVDVVNASKTDILVSSLKVGFYDAHKELLHEETIQCVVDCEVEVGDAGSFGPADGPEGWASARVGRVAFQDAPKRGSDAPRESLDGYAEWWKDGLLVVDGQRVRLSPNGRFKSPGEVASFAGIPLGYEVKVKGRRAADGVLEADEVEVKANGKALFESELRTAFDDLEKKYIEESKMYEGSGKKELGRLLTSGPEVDRVRRILDRLIPGYLADRDFRAYVVENEEWNALAAPNDSIFVFSGILNDMDDDEVAVVLGHELTHATHEHGRKRVKKGLLIQLAALGVAAITEDAVEDKNKRVVLQLATVLGARAWTNGYGRAHEDQADRVGLRYAREGGFDVRKGPKLWNRFAEKYGRGSKVVNFFLGDHSVAQDRERNLARELAINYGN